MSLSFPRKRTIFSGLLALGLFGAIAGAETAEKTPLHHDVYDSWRSIVRPVISSNGEWIAYVEAPQDGDAEIVVIHPGTGKTLRHGIGYTGEGTGAERSADARFTADSRCLIFFISPSRETVKAQKKNKGKDNDKPKKNLAVWNLETDQPKILEAVKAFFLPEENGDWVAVLKEKPEARPDSAKDGETKKKPQEKTGGKAGKKTQPGTPLLLLSLADHSETLYENVTEAAFTKKGDALFFLTCSHDSAVTNGLFRVRPGGPGTQSETVWSGEGVLKKLSFDEETRSLAFLHSKDDTTDHPAFSLYGMDVDDRAPDLWVSGETTKNFPEGMAVTDKSDLIFSEDGRVILFGIRSLPEADEEKDENEQKEEEARFDLWHWNDSYPQPQQKLMAESVRENAWESVYHRKQKAFVRLADETLPDVTLCPTGTIAFGENPWPYAKRVSWDGRYTDVYVVNVHTGERTLVKEELYQGARLSPRGRYVYWFDDGNWFAYDVGLRKTRNLTEGLDVSFAREDHDTPNPPTSYGIAGWTADDQTVLIYDRYDIWEINPGKGNARMITEGAGREERIEFRYVRLDRKEKAVGRDRFLVLKAVNLETLAEGFFRDRVQGSEKPVRLLMQDRSFGYPVKADREDVLLFTRSAFDEYPDLWVSDPDFMVPRKITDLGTQMEPYRWGKAELRDFLSADGKPLKGILIKPDDFNPAMQYPLMVYIYETLHGGLHRYRHPSPGSSVNPSFYVSNGYVLWMPDIEYDTGYPGRDALKCVLPGIHMLIREGFVDPEAVGIQGHSWGGYQIAYMITQTDLFAAAEAGAPVSNMVSAYGGIRWSSGMVRQFQYERTQSRLGASLWEVPLRYLENSPVFRADNVHTPLMMMHNDEDGAVPWYQGIEFIMALRRLEKEAYLFNYNGEGHGLRKRANQKDWTIRMAEFFDHHLKGSPAPDWMIHGIPAWEKEK